MLTHSPALRLLQSGQTTVPLFVDTWLWFILPLSNSLHKEIIIIPSSQLILLRVTRQLRVVWSDLFYEIYGVLQGPASPMATWPLLNGLHLVTWQLVLFFNSTIMIKFFLIFLFCPISFLSHLWKTNHLEILVPNTRWDNSGANLIPYIRPQQCQFAEGCGGYLTNINPLPLLSHMWLVVSKCFWSRTSISKWFWTCISRHIPIYYVIMCVLLC